MTKKCIVCQKEFEAKRSTATYCGDACRQNAKRDKDVQVSVTKEVSVTDDLIQTEKEILRNETPYEETVRMGTEATKVLNSLTLEEIKKKRDLAPELAEDQWVRLGKLLISGKKLEQIELNGKTYKLNPVQTEFICDLVHDHCLNNGGFGSGKTLALNIKLYLFVKCFPGNRILVGRKTLADIERAWLPDFLELVPPGEYEHRVKDAVLNFNNGSQIILFGLDALQAGDLGDIKKAQQKIKSLNLGAYFIDQLEEIEYDVFDALNSRLRLAKVPVRQGNATCNPANFWAYHWFVRKCVKMGDTWVEKENNSGLYMSSMMDNQANLPEDYIRKQLEGHDQKWIDRYVYGKWTPDSLTEKGVFTGFTNKWHSKPPIANEEGCSIWEQPKGQTYKIGVDPSEGVVDPACIAVVSGDGKLVAMFNGKVPINALAERVKFLYWKYHKPQIVLEVNDKAGGALLENIKDLNIYRRQVFEYKDNRTSEKLGFKTNHQTKRMLISNFQGLMKQGFPQIWDQRTIEEFGTFVWADEARLQGAGAQRGFHDDCVMATLLGFWQMSSHKTELQQEKDTRPPRIKPPFPYK